MQADVQCHYFSGYCSTRDLNLNAGCSLWPLNDVNTSTQNGPYYNGNLAPAYPDQYLAYKNNLKQIMLQHEAIFKEQIKELHRVYNRQKELMDEMKAVKFYGHHPQVKALLSNQILPENSFGYSQKKGKNSVLPWLNSACSPSSVSCVENKQPLSKSLEGKIKPAVCSANQTEICREESKLVETKFKKAGKKILDLELPAYEYIDSEQEESLAWATIPVEGPCRPVKSIVKDVQKNDVEMSHEAEDGNMVCKDDSMIQASLSTRTAFLADLNEPIKLEEETDPESNDFPSPSSDDREKPCHDLSEERNSDFQVEPKEIIQNTQTTRDHEAFSNILHLERKESKHEWVSNIEEAGKISSGLNSFPERTFTRTLSTSSEDHEIERDHESSTSHLLNACIEKLQKKSKHISNELSSPDDVMNCDSYSVSSWRKHTHDVFGAPMAVQELPCLSSPVCLSSGSKFRSPQIIGHKFGLDISAKSKAKIQSSSAQSSFCNSTNEFASVDTGTKTCTKDSVDLNLTWDIDLNCASLGCLDVAPQNTPFIRGEEKCKESAGVSPLHKANSLYVADADTKQELDGDYVPNLGEQQNTNQLVSGNELDKTSSGVGSQVDLNSCVKEDKSSLLPFLSSEIDLRAPASPENEERSPPRGESEENGLETTCLISEQENGNLLEDLVTVAAEAIVSFSASKPWINNTENVTLRPSKAAENVSLYWFAKLASSAVDDPESECGVVLSCKNPDHHDGYLSHEIDYFEAMTLKLQETKDEECCYKANVLNDEVECQDSRPNQPRRGRTRRGRQQRKDFQNEILPSLASLSRHEVTEDLQVIGGLIQAAHRSTGTATSRIGWTMGRRRGRIATPSSKAETTVCALLKHQTRHRECRIQDWSLTGWGRKTRRRGRQRSPASNLQLILAKV